MGEYPFHRQSFHGEELLCLLQAFLVCPEADAVHARIHLDVHSGLLPHTLCHPGQNPAFLHIKYRLGYIIVDKILKLRLIRVAQDQNGLCHSVLPEFHRLIDLRHTEIIRQISQLLRQGHGSVSVGIRFNDQQCFLLRRVQCLYCLDVPADRSQVDPCLYPVIRFYGLHILPSFSSVFDIYPDGGTYAYDPAVHPASSVYDAAVIINKCSAIRFIARCSEPPPAIAVIPV